MVSVHKATNDSVTTHYSSIEKYPHHTLDRITEVHEFKNCSCSAGGSMVASRRSFLRGGIRFSQYDGTRPERNRTM